MCAGEQLSLRESLDAQDAAAAIRFESYRLHNAIWDPRRLADGSQEVFLEPHGTPWLAGWRWHWPGHDGQAAAFPQIQFPGDPEGAPSGPRLPCALGAIRQCRVTYDVVTFALGAYCLVLEIGIQRVAPESSERVIRLYLDTAHGVPMIGACVAQVELDERWYAVYPDAATFQASRSVAFVAQIAQLHGHLRLPVFWEYLLRQRFLTEQNLITRISFGNEISSGSGETTVYRYAVHIEH